MNTSKTMNILSATCDIDMKYILYYIIKYIVLIFENCNNYFYILLVNRVKYRFLKLVKFIKDVSLLLQAWRICTCSA